MSPLYDVAHLACTPQQLREGFKFIVTENETGHYRFYADASQRLHIHIRQAMQNAGKLADDERVIGGGWMHSDEHSMLVLHAESNRFGQEPPEVREAFRPLVIVKLREMGIEVE